MEQNPLALDYLEREIKIMKLLRSCEYVVHLHHHQVSGENTIPCMCRHLLTAGYAVFTCWAHSVVTVSCLAYVSHERRMVPQC